MRDGSTGGQKESVWPRTRSGRRRGGRRLSRRFRAAPLARERIDVFQERRDLVAGVERRLLRRTRRGRGLARREDLLWAARGRIRRGGRGGAGAQGRRPKRPQSSGSPSRPPLRNEPWRRLPVRGTPSRERERPENCGGPGTPGGTARTRTRTASHPAGRPAARGWGQRTTSASAPSLAQDTPLLARAGGGSSSSLSLPSLPYAASWLSPSSMARAARCSPAPTHPTPPRRPGALAPRRFAGNNAAQSLKKVSPRDVNGFRLILNHHLQTPSPANPLPSK